MSRVVHNSLLAFIVVSAFVAVVAVACAWMNSNYRYGSPTNAHRAVLSGSVAEIRSIDPQMINSRIVKHPDWRVRGATPLMYVARSKRARGEIEYIVTFLLHAGADIEATDDAGRTALHYAIEEQQATMALVLIRAGAKWDHSHSDRAIEPARFAAYENWSVFFQLLSSCEPLTLPQRACLESVLAEPVMQREGREICRQIISNILNIQ
jgi:hypothetical protein